MKENLKQKFLESYTKEGDSPVSIKIFLIAVS